MLDPVPTLRTLKLCIMRFILLPLQVFQFQRDMILTARTFHHVQPLIALLVIPLRLTPSLDRRSSPRDQFPSILKRLLPLLDQRLWVTLYPCAFRGTVFLINHHITHRIRRQRRGRISPDNRQRPAPINLFQNRIVSVPALIIDQFSQYRSLTHHRSNPFLRVPLAQS